jgi:hypothetical protein
MLALVILRMAASTLAIGLLPTYAAIGDVAPYVAPMFYIVVAAARRSGRNIPIRSRCW